MRMMRGMNELCTEIEELNSQELASLRDLAYNLKHDLAKYVTFHQRWLVDNPTEGERCAAVRDDVLNTRQSAAGRQSALEVWQPFAAVLLGENPLAASTRIDFQSYIRDILDGMACLAELGPVLQSRQVTPEIVEQCAVATQRIAKGCMDLYSRVSQAIEE